MVCSVDFLYCAAMRKPNIETPSGKTVHYDPAPEGKLSGQCWLCGCRPETGHPKKKIIKPTFTDHDLAKIPWSEMVCEHCIWALSYRELRNYSLLATGNGLYHLSRLQIRETLLQPPKPPFLMTVAESGQRWLHFKAKVNLSNQKFTVRMDNYDVMVVPGRFKDLLNIIESLYQVFTKKEIETGQYQSHRIREFGLERWEQLEKTIAPVRRSSLFQLALFIAQREEK
ncbi:MAG: hypothetical protein JRI54_00290 [Deltaproteobacteria bacterium]|nr:hypothetical protein [Deltaproteobacteria bacterium]